MARLKEIYNKEVVPTLVKQFGYKSTMQVPRIEKIVLNMGVGEAIADKKILENAVADMQKISGQKPVITKAKKSIAVWKIRTGYPIGCMVTLRQERMYEFFDRLVSIALPRVRDFRGVSGRSFDGRGNFNMGVKEQIIFPEIEYDKIDSIRGMNITIATTAKTDAEAKALLAAFKFPFKNYLRLKDAHGEKGCHQPRSATPRDGEKVRQKACGAASHDRQHEAFRRGPPGCAAQAAAAAAQRESDAASQPMQADRSPSRRLQQVRPGAQQAARDRDARRNSRRGQGQLVMSAGFASAMYTAVPSNVATDVATELR